MGKKTKNNKAKNEVGYGNPPEHSQFKSGQSGNSKGRPKGTSNLNQILEKLGLEKVSVTENGIKKVMTKIELAMASLLSKAANGDVTAARLLVAISQMPGVPGYSESERPFGEIDHKLVLEEAEWQVYVNKHRKAEDNE
ncbi:MAG: hypothetical protein KUG69_09650 [Marinosulfonomonas sp.]|nr:hypothetical protein [Marinosulfonomonas sp.]